MFHLEHLVPNKWGIPHLGATGYDDQSKGGYTLMDRGERRYWPTVSGAV